jgi:glycosyltransferase involved in cell wall biosynthesis
MYFPLVSIIIPVYNGADFIAEAINSALGQSYKNLEIIVVNDGSNDNSRTDSIIKSYGDKVKYFFKDNGGVGSALNLGIKEMEGEYFSWLSHDDLYLPNKIEEQINFINRINKPDSIIFSNYYLVNASNHFVACSNLSNFYNLDFRSWLTVFSELNGCTLLIPKKFLLELNFDEKLKHTQDYDLWFKLSFITSFEFLPMYLIKSRQHDNQDSKKLEGEALLEVKKLKKNFVHNLNSSHISVRFDLFFLWKISRFIFHSRNQLGFKTVFNLIFKIFRSKLKI